MRGDFSGVEIAEGYLLESTSFDYDTVTVEGPRVRGVDHLMRADRHEPDERR